MVVVRVDQRPVVVVSLCVQNLVCSGKANHVIWVDQFLVQYVGQRAVHSPGTMLWSCWRASQLAASAYRARS